jgi:hypothetical protein
MEMMACREGGVLAFGPVAGYEGVAASTSTCEMRDALPQPVTTFCNAEVRARIASLGCDGPTCRMQGTFEGFGEGWLPGARVVSLDVLDATGASHRVCERFDVHSSVWCNGALTLSVPLQAGECVTLVARTTYVSLSEADKATAAAPFGLCRTDEANSIITVS